MASFVLGGLTLIAAALLVLGAVAVLWRPVVAAQGSLALCGLATILVLAAMAGGGEATLALPLGIPGGAGFTLSIDGLSACFLLLLALAGTAASLAALDSPREYHSTAGFLPVFLAGMLLTLLAADGFALVTGFEVMSLASAALVLTGQREEQTRSAALLYIGMAALGAACLVPALALIAGDSLDLRFAALRAHPPEGWRAAAALALVLVGAGSKAGLAPLHVWLPPAHTAAPAHISALMSGAMTKVALYVLIRLLFDLCGPAQPMWWGVPLLLLGAASAVLGALRANMENDIKAVLACSTIENIGLMVIGLGLALAARAADLSQLAALALGGTLLHAMAHGLFKSLLFLAAGAVQHGAGTRRLDRLGGLIHRMPVTTICVLVGAASLAALPPTSGFAGEWALFQAALAAPRIGGLGMQILVCAVTALMALAAALAAAASVRLVGVGFLGRPRSPRASAAEEAGPATRWALIGLAGVSVLAGVFAGPLLQMAAPALRLTIGTAATAGLGIAPSTDAAGYDPVALLVLLALAGGLVFWTVRRFTLQGHRTGPAWDCGFGDPPAWLPFGDPATQYGGASFSQPLRRTLAAPLLGARETVDMPAPGDIRAAGIAVTMADPAEMLLFAPLARWRDAGSGLADRMQFLTVRRILQVMFIVLVGFLALVVVLEAL
jgi:hydrogenase-4 component B